MTDLESFEVDYHKTKMIGINPGLLAAHIGHHYAGPGNHFWKCLYLSGLVPEPMNCYDDIKIQKLGIGFTNMCARTTRGSADLKRTEIQEGGAILREKLKEYKPKIAVFNGKGIYEVFSGSKKITFGKQPVPIEGTDTLAFVMPSSSARCAQLPRATDKVPFYEALRKLRDHLVGHIPYLDDADVTFPTLELKNVKKENPVKAENDEDGVLGSSSTVSNSSGGQEENKLNLHATVKQEVRKRGRPKGKGKKAGEQGQGQMDQTVGAELTLENQLRAESQQTAQHQPDIHVPQDAQGIAANPFPTDFTALRPSSASASHFFPSLLSSNVAWPGMPPSLQASQDFQYHQFGLIGYPSVVASQQQCAPPADDGSMADSLQIKAEPVDVE